MSFPPPQLLPDTIKEITFFNNLIQSVYSLWFESDKLNTLHESEALTTTDATIATLDQIELEENTTAHIHSTIVAVESGSGNRATYEIIGTFYRVLGPAVQQGVTTSLHSIESDGSWAVSYDVSANSARIRVTGAAASIDWRSSSRIMRLSN